MPVVMHIPYKFSLLLNQKSDQYVNPYSTFIHFEQASIYRSLVVYIIILKWWLSRIVSSKRSGINTLRMITPKSPSSFSCSLYIS